MLPLCVESSVRWHLMLPFFSLCSLVDVVAKRGIGWRCGSQLLGVNIGESSISYILMVDLTNLWLDYSTEQMTSYIYV